MSLRYVRSKRGICITGKHWYASEIEAKAALHMGMVLGARAYDCDKCNGWHVTSQPYVPADRHCQ